MNNKVLMFYINAINGGGAERVIIQLAHHFSLEGYESILVTSFVDHTFEYEVPKNVRRISIEQDEIDRSRLSRNYHRIVELRKLIKKYHPLAIISFMAEPNTRAIIATRGLKTKNIVSVRNDPTREYSGKLGCFVGKVLLPIADGCVFQTEDAKGWFPIKLQKKSAVIMNDVKEEFFSIERSNVEDVVIVGRLNKQKNHKLAISAFAQIANKYPDVKLRLFGDGNLRNDLLRQIQDLGMESRVVLHGSTDDVVSVLKHARIFVLSSDYEGMPNCLMEALAAGVPCISTDCPCGGPKMLIKNGYNGLLVPINDENALSQAISSLLEDTSNAEKLGENAKQEAKKYHPELIFSQWKKYVESIIDN